MISVAGVFSSEYDARRVAGKLRGAGLRDDRLALLLPAGSGATKAVPVTSAEQPGIGKAVGATVGAAVGAAAGAEVGAILTAVIPGVGPVIAAGLLGAALVGLAAGVGAGATLGSKLDNSLSEGIPEDELYIYEDALRHGRSVVIALADNEQSAEPMRSIMKQMGAETVDAARDKWWVGLRDVEREHYTAAHGRDFKRDEAFYRCGFEAAMHARTRGKEFDQVASEMAEDLEELQQQYPGVEVEEPFRRGYERGRAHFEFLRGKK
jgi:hypothetical protein